MDKKTRQSLFSGVDAYGNPKWEPATLDDLSQDEIEGVPGDELTHQFLDDTWSIEPTVDSKNDEPVDPRSRRIAIGIAVGVFLFAVLIRLYFLYFVSDSSVIIPTWSNDTYHHWQIGYLSKEIGFSKGFLRLWDLKGMEYFWGVLHPVLLAVSFTITGSVDIMIPRLLSLVAGSLCIVYLFLLGRKYWNTQVGLAIAVLCAINPIVIFNDPSGMVEPFGFLFLLAGLYVFPNRSLLAGFLWALAAMARAESWLFSGGLLVAALLSRQSSDRKMGLVMGWAVPMVFYMKYLLDWTGNAIYPLYWNFLANAAGEWVYRETYTSYQLAVRPILVGTFTLALLAALWTLWKRPRAYLLYLLGFGTTAFITGFIGLTPYLTGYETWFWLTRFFTFPYKFLIVLIVVFLVDWLPKKINFIGKSRISWIGVVAVGFVIQFTWPAVLYDL
ncbi:MAG: glycosyltransferase family 39 protein, partial [Gammaproteobacteria bacterium]|nr:glycosyltransferase family 39 protein [Gammaproteobacteria bacterium]